MGAPHAHGQPTEDRCYRLTDLGPIGLVPDVEGRGSFGINDKGECVGYMLVDGEVHAFVWLPEPAYGLEAGVLHDLSVLGNVNGPSQALDINEGGIVVGSIGPLNGVGDCQPTRAFDIDDSWTPRIVGALRGQWLLERVQGCAVGVGAML